MPFAGTVPCPCCPCHLFEHPCCEECQPRWLCAKYISEDGYTIKRGQLTCCTTVDGESCEGRSKEGYFESSSFPYEWRGEITVPWKDTQFFVTVTLYLHFGPTYAGQCVAMLGHSQTDPQVVELVESESGYGCGVDNLSFSVALPGENTGVIEISAADVTRLQGSVRHCCCAVPNTFCVNIATSTGADLDYTGCVFASGVARLVSYGCDEAYIWEGELLDAAGNHMANARGTLGDELYNDCPPLETLGQSTGYTTEEGALRPDECAIKWVVEGSQDAVQRGFSNIEGECCMHLIYGDCRTMNPRTFAVSCDNGSYLVSIQAIVCPSVFGDCPPQGSCCSHPLPEELVGTITPVAGPDACECTMASFTLTKIVKVNELALPQQCVQSYWEGAFEFSGCDEDDPDAVVGGTIRICCETRRMVVLGCGECSEVADPSPDDFCQSTGLECGASQPDIWDVCDADPILIQFLDISPAGCPGESPNLCRWDLLVTER